MASLEPSSMRNQRVSHQSHGWNNQTGVSSAVRVRVGSAQDFEKKQKTNSTPVQKDETCETRARYVTGNETAGNEENNRVDSAEMRNQP